MSRKIIHMGDSHLGYSQYQSDVRRKDFSRAFDEIIEYAISENIDAIIHTGDLFDSPNPSTKTINELFESLTKLKDADIDFIGIVGNHERKWSEQWLDIYETVDFVTRLSTDPFVIGSDDDDDAPVNVYGFDAFRKTEWDKEKFNLSGFEEDHISIVCFHELFDELVHTHETERELKTVIDNITPKPDIIALGDYHATSETEMDGVKAFYCGATERTKLNANKPSIRVITVEDDSFTVHIEYLEEILDDAPRPFYPVSVDVTESTDRDDIRRRITEEVPDERLDESVVVVKLVGKRVDSIQPSIVHDVLDNMDTKVTHVTDAREVENTIEDVSDVSDPSMISIDDKINDELPDVSTTVQEIEQQVRDMSIAKSNVRDEVSDILTGDNE